MGREIVSGERVRQAVEYLHSGLAILLHPGIEEACADPKRLLWRLEGELGMLELLGIAPEKTEELRERLTQLQAKEKASCPAAGQSLWGQEE